MAAAIRSISSTCDAFNLTARCLHLRKGMEVQILMTLLVCSWLLMYVSGKHWNMNHIIPHSWQCFPQYRRFDQCRVTIHAIHVCLVKKAGKGPTSFDRLQERNQFWVWKFDTQNSSNHRLHMISWFFECQHWIILMFLNLLRGYSPVSFFYWPSWTSFQGRALWEQKMEQRSAISSPICGIETGWNLMSDHLMTGMASRFPKCKRKNTSLPLKLEPIFWRLSE